MTRSPDSVLSLVTTGAIAALTGAILWLGTKVTDVSERLARVETQVTMILQHQRGITGPYDDLDRRLKEK